MALVGCARVSTPGQNLDPQMDALRNAGWRKIFEDYVGGAKTARPGLDKALAWLRNGDMLVVWELDRHSSSVTRSGNAPRPLAKGVAASR